MENIIISICIPTYNQAKYIEKAVRSAYKQTIMPDEIIVSDDHSTDNTYDILNELTKEIPILKIYRQPVNKGISGNVDDCLRMASGNFIIRLDSDDQLLPGYTQKLLDLFNRYPQAGYAHCAVQEIDQEGNLLNKRRLIRGTGFKPALAALKDSVDGYRVAANIIMFKKEALIKVNYLTGRPDFGEDYHLTSEISANGFGNVYYDEILACYRVWVDAGNVRQKRKLAEINGITRVFTDVLQGAYKKLNWNLHDLEKSRSKFACRQADCLSWDIYTAAEKEEIITEIHKLSDSPIAKMYIWMYMNGFATAIKLYDFLRSFPKSIIKYLLKKASGLKPAATH